VGLRVRFGRGLVSTNWLGETSGGVWAAAWRLPRAAEPVDRLRCFRGEVLRHVRACVKRPPTIGVVERFFGALKYEHFYRCELDDGDALALETNLFRRTYNTIRPYQALGVRTPKHASGDSGSTRAARRSTPRRDLAQRERRTMQLEDSGILLRARVEQRECVLRPPVEDRSARRLRRARELLGLPRRTR